MIHKLCPKLVWCFSQAIRLRHIDKGFCLSVYLSIYLKTMCHWHQGYCYSKTFLYPWVGVRYTMNLRSLALGSSIFSPCFNTLVKDFCALQRRFNRPYQDTPLKLPQFICRCVIYMIKAKSRQWKVWFLYSAENICLVSVSTFHVTSFYFY